MAHVPGVLRIWLPLLLAVLAGGVTHAAHAADPQPYTVKIAPTGDKALDAALQDAASLIALKDKAPVAGFALVQRASQDVGRFEAALQSYGYYKARIAVMIAGRPVDDPGLPDLIDHAPASPPVAVEIGFDLGPQFRIGRVAIDGALPPGMQDALGLTAGQPALAADVVAARERLLAALREAGYPLAKVELPPATLRPSENLLDATFEATAGPPADFGPVTITGLKNMNESAVRRRLLLHPGERFSPSAIARAQQDLSAMGVFSVVRILPAESLDEHGQLPLTLDVTERQLHAVDVGVAYSTDLGINLNAAWHHRNLFGNAEQLNLTGAVQLGGNAVTKPGYQLGVQFIKPDFLARDQALELDLNAVKQSLQAYDQRALLEKAALNRKVSPHWTISVGIAGEQEEITQELVRRHYNLVGLPLTAKYDSTASLLDPTSGIRAAFMVTPTGALSTRNSSFVILQASASTYLDFGSQGRSVLALRGLLGSVPGAGVFAMPPDQRFYAGGSATVRGFRYQSIGPHFPDNKPTGGTAVAAGSVEFRQRILDKYGVVAFVDAGQVTSHGAPFSHDWRIGAGIGVRYYTPIGPIRLDVAMPLNRQPGGDAFELYIGIGQAF